MTEIKLSAKEQLNLISKDIRNLIGIKTALAELAVYLLGVYDTKISNDLKTLTVNYEFTGLKNLQILIEDKELFLLEALNNPSRLYTFGRFGKSHLKKKINELSINDKERLLDRNGMLLELIDNPTKNMENIAVCSRPAAFYFIKRPSNYAILVAAQFNLFNLS